VDDLGFFSMEERYMPEDECCDRFTYRLTVTAGGRTHSVETMDATPHAPEELLEILDRANDLIGPA
jgi:hypothetical protein